MIRSTNLTVVQAAVTPLPAKSLVAGIVRPGDSVSLNPQPLPPKAVFANVKAVLDATNPAANFSPSLTMPATATDIPLLTLQGGLHHRTIVPPAVRKQLSEADQLTKAEKLMEDAYKTISNPNSNQVDRFRAEEERAQALQIRNSVAPELSEYQQKALSAVSLQEQQGIEDAAWGVFDTKYGNPPADSLQVQKGAQELQTGKEEFQLGVQENQSLINWILS